MKNCEKCSAPLKETVCQTCGSALYNDNGIIIRITPSNYDSGKPEELSLKFMLSFIKGTLKRMKN